MPKVKTVKNVTECIEYVCASIGENLIVGTPLGIGKPNEIFPWQWSIIPWYDGENACIARANNSEVIKLSISSSSFVNFWYRS